MRLSQSYILASTLAAAGMIALPLYFVVTAANGDLDPTFGNAGKVVTSFPGGLDTAEGVAVQSDGKIVVAGSSGSDFALTRYNTDGQLDSTFGSGGRVHTDFPVGQGGLGNALVIQSDGKIVVAGSAGSGTSEFAIVRYNTDGTLDSSFDGDGRVVTGFPGSSATARAIAIQTDGKLVLAGVSTDNTTFQSVFALARYNPNGSLDSTFDGDGRVTTDFPGVTFEEAHAVAIQSNGRIVAAGLGSSAFALARYNTDGSLDSGVAPDLTPGDSFGPAGLVTTAFGGSFEEANDLAIQTDGRIVAAGETALSVASEDNFAVARYNTDGSLDNSFDTDGKVTTDFGLVDSGNEVVIQTDGRIVVAGSAGTIPLGSFFALARYNTDGSPDNAFDTDGKVTTDFSGGRFSLGALGVALQTDGRIVAAGDANASGNRDFGVARYNTNGSPDNTFDGDGKVTTDFPLNEEGITGLVRQPDDKIVAVGRFNGGIRISQAQDPNFQIARYNAADGSLDPTFGNGGLVATDFLNHGDDFANGVALQSDNKIVVVGQSGAHFSQIPSADTVFAVARYTSNGTLDSSFDGDGLATTDFGTSHDTAFAVAIQSDGKIVVAGTNGSDFVLARYNTDGSLDSGAAGDLTPGDSFGTAGKVITDFSGGIDVARAVLIQSDGKIVAAGSAGTDFGLVRYNTDGNPDSTGFGTGGKVTTDFAGNSDAANALVIQADNKLVAAGSAINPGTDSDFAVARYNTNGTLDTAGFGTGGKTTTDFGGFDSAGGLALQLDGKPVLVGFNFPTGGGAALFAVARYDTGGILDPTFGAGGKVTTDFFGVNSEGSAVAIQSDGKIIAGGFADTGSSNDFALARYVGVTATPTPSPTPSPSPSPSPSPVVIQFSASNYTVSEATATVMINVVRTGDTAPAVNVDYATSDAFGLLDCGTVNGAASDRCDYTTALGTLKFAAGETSKSFHIFITDDAWVDGSETAQLTLSNPTNGATLGAQQTATLTISDNDANNNVPNPINDPAFFIGRQYVDLLYRLPDPVGQSNWLNTLQNCPNGGFGNSNPECDRVKVSLGFYFSTEFGERGYLVMRMFEASLGVRPTYREFMRDLQRIGGQLTPAEYAIEKQAYVNDFMARPAFQSLYGGMLTPSQASAFVSALEQTAGVTLANRNTLISEMQSGQKTAAQTLEAFVDSPEVFAKFINPGLIEMLYFGYLRRAPDPVGFSNWMQVLNQSGDFRQLVYGFLYSDEYKRRFGAQ